MCQRVITYKKNFNFSQNYRKRKGGLVTEFLKDSFYIQSVKYFQNCQRKGCLGGAPPQKSQDLHSSPVLAPFFLCSSLHSNSGRDPGQTRAAWVCALRWSSRVTPVATQQKKDRAQSCPGSKTSYFRLQKIPHLKWIIMEWVARQQELWRQD